MTEETKLFIEEIVFDFPKAVKTAKKKGMVAMTYTKNCLVLAGQFGIVLVENFYPWLKREKLTPLAKHVGSLFGGRS